MSDITEHHKEQRAKRRCIFEKPKEEKNKDRARRALDALKFYAGRDWAHDEPEEFVSDLLSDLMHFADHAFPKIDFEQRLRHARECYDSEIEIGEAL